MDAAEALRIGLVQQVYPADQCECALSKLTETILVGSPFTLRESKRMLNIVAGALAPSETEESLDQFVEATQSADFGEGVDAFLAKRPPQFRRG